MKAIYAQFIGALAMTFTIAGCAADPVPPPPAPTPAPPPAPVVVPADVLTPAPVTTLSAPQYANYLDAPQTEGTWFYERMPMQTRAVFGTSPDAAAFVFSCDLSSRRIAMTRADSTQTERAGRIRTETARRDIAFAPPAPGSRAIRATVAANDTLLDAMAITKGRFAVETAGLPTLYLPAWVEVSRVIEDCR